MVPAFQTLKTFYEARYLPAAATQLGASSLPGGLAYYQALLGWFTTTNLDARQIHDLGLKEVARINEQMDATMRRFHNAVIDGGALPLQVLEAQIDEWIAGQLAVAKCLG